MEYVLEGWGSGPFEELARLKNSDSIKIVSEKASKEFFPILEGDEGEQATFTTITIEYEGELW